MPRSTLRVILIAFASFIVLGMHAAVIGVLWSPHILTDFQQSLGDLGVFLVVSTVGYFAGSSSSGRIFSRYPVGIILSLGMCLSGLGILGYALSPSWTVMIALSLVTNFGLGLLDGGMNIYFAAHFNASLMNWLHASFGVGALIAPQLVNGLVLSLNLSWRSAYLAIAALFALSAVLFWLTRQQWLPVHHTEQHSGMPIQATLRLPVVWMGVIVFVCYTGLEAGAGTWAAPFFQAQAISEAVANNWVTAYWLSFTIGRIFFGAIVTRFRAADMMRLCMLGSLVGALVLVWRPFPEANVLGVLIFGFTLAPCFALMITATQERLGSAHAPNAIGVQVAAASFGGGVVPAVMGSITNSAGILVMPLLLVAMTLVMFVFYQWSLSPSFEIEKVKPVQPLA